MNIHEHGSVQCHVVGHRIKFCAYNSPIASPDE